MSSLLEVCIDGRKPKPSQAMYCIAAVVDILFSLSALFGSTPHFSKPHNVSFNTPFQSTAFHGKQLLNDLVEGVVEAVDFGSGGQVDY